MRTRTGRLKPRSGGRVKRLLSIFANPKLPAMADYYEPWTYDYEHLLTAPAGTDTPVARPKSLLTGKDTKVTWSANWDDSLAGGNEIAAGDPILRQLSDQVRQEYEKAFLFFLPRICEHCLNPSCAASCPSGAIYKRAEDGIVLVDQDRCRGWRMCVTGCPYKKIYFNHRTGKAEKCTFCFPRIEIGQPTICSETCVGRLRYLGLMLYDADAVGEGRRRQGRARRCTRRRGRCSSTRTTPRVVAAAREAGIPDDWITAAQRSPIWDLIMRYEVALPLHPEYRTMPMVWYIPPLSPVVDILRDTGHDGEDVGNLFGAVDALRIPVDYLAGLFTAGDPGTGHRRAATARRDARLPAPDQPRRGPRRVHRRRRRHDRPQMDDMYRLLAIAKYEERYVIPAAHAEDAHHLEQLAHRMQPRLRRRARHGRLRTVRRGVRHSGADLRGELPHAPQPADRRHRQRPRTTNRPGSTCSTGTARAAPRACSRPNATATSHDRDRRGVRSPPARRPCCCAIPTATPLPSCPPSWRLSTRCRRRWRSRCGWSPSIVPPPTRAGSRTNTCSCSTSAGAAACT